MSKQLKHLLLNYAMLILLVIQIAVAVRLWLNKVEGVEGSGVLANARLATDFGFIALTLILLYMYRKKEEMDF